MNNLSLIGRLTRDAELKYTAGGMAVAEFALAVNERRKKGEEWVDEANFFDCTLFGKRAEALQRYLIKGKQLGVAGSLRQDRWQDKETGANRSKIRIIANDVTLLGGGGEESAGPRPATSAPPEHDPNEVQFTDDFPDNIPF